MKPESLCSSVMASTGGRPRIRQVSSMDLTAVISLLEAVLDWTRFWAADSSSLKRFTEIVVGRDESEMLETHT